VISVQEWCSQARHAARMGMQDTCTVRACTQGKAVMQASGERGSRTPRFRAQPQVLTRLGTTPSASFVFLTSTIADAFSEPLGADGIGMLADDVGVAMVTDVDDAGIAMLADDVAMLAGDVGIEMLVDNVGIAVARALSSLGLFVLAGGGLLSVSPTRGPDVNMSDGRLGACLSCTLVTTGVRLGITLGAIIAKYAAEVARTMHTATVRPPLASLLTGGGARWRVPAIVLCFFEIIDETK
jgi:hypothetical protein